jgi:Mlc titration factor MtfA (ptsG expression regulator)
MKKTTKEAKKLWQKEFQKLRFLQNLTQEQKERLRDLSKMLTIQ